MLTLFDCELTTLGKFRIIKTDKIHIQVFTQMKDGKYPFLNLSLKTKDKDGNLFSYWVVQRDDR